MWLCRWLASLWYVKIPDFFLIFRFFQRKLTQLIVCLFLVPRGILKHPTALTYHGQMAGVFLKLFDLAWSVGSLVACLESRDSFYDHVIDKNFGHVHRQDITQYLCVVYVAGFILNLVCLVATVFLWYLSSCYLYARNNHVDPGAKRTMSICQELNAEQMSHQGPF